MDVYRSATIHNDRAALLLALTRWLRGRPRPEAAPIRIRDIDHVVLRVADPAPMIRFYTRVLGCAVEREQPEVGLIQLRAGRSLIDLVPVDGRLGRAGGRAPGAEGRNLDHFCLRVDGLDMAAIRRHLAQMGVATEPPANRYGADGDGLSLYVRDPEGNGVELRAAADRPV